MSNNFFNIGGLVSDISVEFNREIILKGDIRLGGKVKVSDEGSKIGGNFSRALKSGGMILAEEMDIALKEAISSNIWSSRNGVVDIVDSGDLMNSQAVEFRGGGIKISYDVPYASIVHYGGYIVPYGNSRISRVYIPARPWVSELLGGNLGVNLGEIYRRAILRVLSKSGY